MPFIKTYTAHFKATMQLAWPIMLGQLGQVMMGIVDALMVGNVGEKYLAAANASNAVFFLVTIFGIGVSTAVAPLVSMAVAEKNEAKTGGILRGAYKAAVIVGIGIQLILSVLILNFGSLGQPEEVTPLATEFLWILSFSVIPMVLFLCTKQFADGLSYTKPAMIITVAALAFNAFVNWLLIYGNWGFPELKLAGAGYATTLTRVLMVLVMLAYIHTAPNIRKYIVQRPVNVNHYLRSILKMGIPSGMQYFFEIAAFGGAAIMAGWISITASAAHGIAISLASFTYMAATGISAAGAIRVGGYYGQQDALGIRKAGYAALLLGMGWMVLACGIFLLFKRSLVGLYITHPQVELVAGGLLVIAAFFQLSDGIQTIGLGILRGIADVKAPTYITFFSYWGIGIPVGYVLGFYTGMGINGIWIGLLIGLTVSAVFLTLRFFRLTRKKFPITT